MTGLIITAIFTATVTSALTAASLETGPSSLAGLKVGINRISDGFGWLPKFWVMLHIPSQYMHYGVVLLCEVYGVIVRTRAGPLLCSL